MSRIDTNSVILSHLKGDVEQLFVIYKNNYPPECIGELSFFGGAQIKKACLHSLEALGDLLCLADKEFYKKAVDNIAAKKTISEKLLVLKLLNNDKDVVLGINISYDDKSDSIILHIQDLQKYSIINDLSVKLQKKTEEFLAQSEEYASQNEEMHGINEELLEKHKQLEHLHNVLHHSEEQYKMLFESLAEGYALHEIITDKKGKAIDYRFIEINPAFEEITGLKRKDCIGKTVLEVLPKTEKVWIENYGKVALLGEQISFKNYSRELEKHFYVRAFSPERGKFAVTFSDISELEDSYHKLKESEERLKILFEDAPDAYYISDLKGRFLDGNKAAEKLIGYAKGELIGKNFFELNILIKNQLPKAVRNMAKNALGQRTGPDEFRLRLGDGSVKEVEISTFPVKIKGELCILGIARDISKRKEMERSIKVEASINKLFTEVANTLLLSEYNYYQLAELIKNYAKAITKSKIAIVTYMQDGMQLANEVPSIWKQCFKKTIQGNELIILRENCVFNQVHAKSDPFWIDDENDLDAKDIEMLQDLKVNRLLAVPVFVHAKFIGQIVVANAPNAYTKENIKHLQHLAHIFSIVSQRKQAEEELVRAKKNAEESDRLKSAFLANMSHELRTPMNGILGFSSLMLRPNLSNEKKKHYHKLISSGAKALMNIIDDIIDISKIESEQLKLEKEACDLRELCEELHEAMLEYRNSKKKSYLDLELEIDFEESCLIETDPFRLKQILNNLLVNAIKNTKTGYVKFGFYKNEKGFIQFYVKDSGIGIPKDQHQKVFDRFAQASGYGHKFQEGTGLGLAISKNLVALLGGEIWLESEVKVGSSFYFTHPYIQAKEPTAKDEFEGSGDVDFHGFNLLIAEDSNVNFEFLVEVLEPTGINIDRAENGYQVIEKVKQNCPDIILMDIKMPGMDGIEATKKIKKMYPKLPVVAQTAFAMQDEKTKSLAIGFAEYLSKPISQVKLISVMEKLLK